LQLLFLQLCMSAFFFATPAAALHWCWRPLL
jgi:hypothetical protein